jgi:hypothetical protein
MAGSVGPLTDPGLSVYGLLPLGPLLLAHLSLCPAEGPPRPSCQGLVCSLSGLLSAPCLVCCLLLPSQLLLLLSSSSHHSFPDLAALAQITALATVAAILIPPPSMMNTQQSHTKFTLKWVGLQVHSELGAWRMHTQRTYVTLQTNAGACTPPR